MLTRRAYSYRFKQTPLSARFSVILETSLAKQMSVGFSIKQKIIIIKTTTIIIQWIQNQVFHMVPPSCSIGTPTLKLVNFSSDVRINNSE